MKKDESSAFTEGREKAVNEEPSSMPKHLREELYSLRCPACRAKPSGELLHKIETCDAEEFVEMLAADVFECHECGAPYLSKDEKEGLLRLSSALRSVLR